MKFKNNIFYFILVGGLTLLIWWLLGEGRHLESGKLTGEALPTSAAGHWSEALKENLFHPLSMLILQIITIITVARFFGLLFKRIGQPAVVGEILAGILLGPSLLGWLLPDVSSFLFPASSFSNLQFLSQIGLLLFMFTIGLELDPSKLRLKAHEAVIISHASILIPFFLGVLLSFAIYREFAPADVRFTAFALFIGISMSITAFPVLARIVQERGLSHKPVGMMVITCAAADDVTAWCLLAVVIAIVKASSLASALITIALAVGYVLLMFLVVRPMLAKFGQRFSSREAINRPVVALIFSILLISSWLTEVIGIHALFGAFLAGIVMPQQLEFKRVITEKIEDVALVLLLPLFFVFTGLRTQVGLLNDASLWATCLAVTGVAVVGKFAGSAIAAKYVGMNWRDSLSIGALMNSRGLMELVVLNIGYDMGVLSPEIFAMLVLMALITTFMTGPALDLIEKYFPEKLEKMEEAAQQIKVLISFGKAEMGRTLLHLAHLLTPSKDKTEFTALHISPRYDVSPDEAKSFEMESFRPVKAESARLKMEIKTHYGATEDISEEIISYTEKYNPDILLLGAAQSLFSKNLTGGKIGKILDHVQCDTLVFSDKGFTSYRNILVIYYGSADDDILDYALFFTRHPNTQLCILDLSGGNASAALAARKFPASTEIIQDKNIHAQFLNRFDLMLVAKDKWEKILESESVWIAHCPSLILVQKGRNTNRLFSLKPGSAIIPVA